MKRLLLILVLALALAGCRKANDEDCKLNWRTLTSEVDSSILSAGDVANMVMNQKMLPGTVGEYVHQCLEEGYRPPGL